MHGEAANFTRAKWESRVVWSDFARAKRRSGGRGTFARRSGKPGGLVDFNGAKRRSGRPWPPPEKPLRAYIRKEKPRLRKGDETANFVTKGRQARRRFDAGSSPVVRRNVAGKTWLFGAKRAKLAMPKGKKAERPKTPPAAPRGQPAASPTTVTGPRPRATSAVCENRRPRPSQPAREGSLGAPNDRTFPLRRRAESPKGKRKGGQPR